MGSATAPWLVLIGVCVIVFAVSAGLCVPESTDAWWTMAWSMNCPVALRSVGAAELAELWERGGWWRVWATGFVHGSALHLTLNMWSLWVIGPWASRAWGHAGAVGCFLASSVGGVLASIAWAEAPVVVGASAGILGIGGGLWVSRGWGSAEVKGRVELVSTRGLGITLAAMVGLGFAVPMIAQAGHLGGLAVGTAIGAGLSGVGGRYGRGVFLSLAAMGVLALATLARAPEWRANYFAFRGFARLEAGDQEAAVPLLREALARDGDSADLQNGVAYSLAEAGVELVEAEALVDQALTGDADNADYLDTKGWILCRRGEAEEGLVWIRKASEASEGGVPEIEEHLETCADAAVFHVEHTAQE